jgi:hypothetical protein
VTGQHSIRCPRCNGVGIIALMRPDKAGKRHKTEADCPMCRGTGRASMLEPMGARRAGDRPPPATREP